MEDWIGHRAARRRRVRNRRRGRVAALVAVPFAALVVVVFAAAAGVGVAAQQYREFLGGCTLDRPARVAPQSSFVYAADGSFLGTLPSAANRQPVALERTSKWLRAAVVAVEDRRFREHDGVDAQGVARAAVENARAGEVVEGASTITQQVARLLFLTNERTLERKKEEACLALKIDASWSKDRILETYLNRVALGNRALGVEAASRTYFSLPAAKLGPARAALLAGMIQAPSRYDPFRRPEAALARRNLVLSAMVETGKLTRAQGAKARARPLGLRPGGLYRTRREPLILDEVQRRLEQVYGADAVARGGFRVYTTISPRLQREGRAAIRRTLGSRDDPATAIATVDSRNGAIRALVSVSRGKTPGFDLASQGSRQTGSSFKTFVLAEAIRRGAHPYKTRYSSTEFSFVPGPGQKPWTPKTFSGREYGPSNLVQATLRSDNLVYAKLTLDVGPAAVARLAGRLGVRAPLKPVPSIGLGANDVTPLGMASAYATLSAQGVHREPFLIRRVVLANGQEDDGAVSREPPRRVLPTAVAFHVTQILRQNVERGTGTAARLGGRPAAGKTGTTDEHTDAWFVGYTPQLSTAVWVGYPTRTRRMTNVRGIRVTGGSFPAQIWGDYMRAAHRGMPVRRFPAPGGGVDWRPCCGDRALED